MLSISGHDSKLTLKADPTKWLLGDDNPSVRYFTLRDVVGRSEYDPDVAESRKAIMQGGLVPEFLVRWERGLQRASKGGTARGYWGRPENFYAPGKYKSTVWTLMILAELGADSADERVRRACELILDSSQDRESGGFAWKGSPSGGGSHGRVIPCLTGNMVWSLIRLGYLDDPRVQRGIDWITRYQRFDDGIAKPVEGWPYIRRSCWGRHSCHMGVVKALKALAEIPVDRRSEAVSSSIERGAEYMLVHHVHKRSHDLTQVSIPGWMHLGFPLMWNTDVLEVLGILTRLGYHDIRMQEAIDLVVSKPGEDGRWRLERSFNGRFLIDIEKKGRPSKWVTLNAVRVLKRFYE